MKKVFLLTLLTIFTISALSGCKKDKDGRLSAPYDVDNKTQGTDSVDVGSMEPADVTLDLETGSVVSTPKNNDKKNEPIKETIGEDDVTTSTDSKKNDSSASSSDKSNSSSSSSSSSSSGKDNSSSSSSDDNKQSMDGWSPWR